MIVRESLREEEVGVKAIMSWLNDLAGQAEMLLNKIDQGCTTTWLTMAHTVNVQCISSGRWLPSRVVELLTPKSTIAIVHDHMRNPVSLQHKDKICSGNL